MVLTWKWIGFSLVVAAYFLLVYWQRRHWRSPSTELGIITVTMMFFDWIMTWLGQFPFYWSGQLSAPIVNEVNPIGWFLLKLHPMAFAVAFIFYMIIIIALIRFFCRWSRFVMIVISSMITCAHGYFAFQWLFDPTYSTNFRWISRRIEDVPFEYLPFILIGLIFGLLLIRKRKK